MLNSVQSPSRFLEQSCRHGRSGKRVQECAEVGLLLCAQVQRDEQRGPSSDCGDGAARVVEVDQHAKHSIAIHTCAVA